ncbi:MAG: cysteine desulfurase family protein [Chloroherpetonaceae bacterium]|nr:cysteine desulfurase family protein [Chloroherpetonaceae bacterium]
MIEPIYLDNASTTPLDPEVFDAMKPYFSTHFGNPSSIHSFGQFTKNALEDSREKIAHLLNAKPSEIFFSSGGTESNNMAVKGFFFSNPKDSLTVLTSKLEHKAVLEPLAWLSNKFSVQVNYISHDETGKIITTGIEDFSKGERLLVSIMLVNNELGNINPIELISEKVKKLGGYFHTDAVQAIGKVPFSLKGSSISLATVTAHKFYGPKGIGALFIREGTPIDSLLHGGSHERNRRAGTESAALAVGFAKALEISIRDFEKNDRQIRHVSALFLDSLSASLKDSGITFSLNGNENEKIAHVLNLSFHLPTKKRLASDVFLLAMDAVGVAISSGSACTSGTEKPSHVLLALGKTEDEARLSARISFSKFTTERDVLFASEKIPEALKRISK